jgi:hypothetical protein
MACGVLRCREAGLGEQGLAVGQDERLQLRRPQVDHGQGLAGEQADPVRVVAARGRVAELGAVAQGKVEAGQPGHEDVLDLHPGLRRRTDQEHLGRARRRRTQFLKDLPVHRGLGRGVRVVDLAAGGRPVHRNARLRSLNQHQAAVVIDQDRPRGPPRHRYLHHDLMIACHP